MRPWILLAALAPLAVTDAAALAPPAGLDAPTGFLHPGALITYPLRCTVAFIHEHAGEVYFSTAGHCVRNGSRVLVATSPTHSADVGAVVRVRDAGPGDDWALVRIDPPYRAHVDHRVPGFGKPTPGPPARQGLYGHVGWGLATPGVPRVGVPTSGDSDGLDFLGVASHGDSGSPVLALGADGSRAPVGILGHIVVGTRGALIHATPIDRVTLGAD